MARQGERRSSAAYGIFLIGALGAAGAVSSCTGRDDALGLSAASTSGQGGGGVGGGGGGGAGGSGGEPIPCKLPADCDDGDVCTDEGCGAGFCLYSTISADDGDPCTADACDPVTGVSHVMANVDDGDPCTADACDKVAGVQHTPLACDDGDPCTADACAPGAGCVSTPMAYFTEDFANNSKGWVLDAGWEIGAAMASSGQQQGWGTDPAEDHTPTADNGIAGAFIGDNVPKMNTAFLYMTSPKVDLSAVNTPVFLEIWRVLNSDFPPYMDSTVEVWDAAKSMWATLFSVAKDVAIQENTQASPGWVKASYDVSMYKSAVFQVRFGYQVIDGGQVYSVGGWNLDDVRLVPSASCK